MVVWVNDMRKGGLPVSTLMLKLEAIDVAAEHEITDFAASWSWRRRFMERYKFSLRFRKRQGQKTPEQLDKTATEFAALVTATMQKLGFSVVHNANQTGICLLLFLNMIILLLCACLVFIFLNLC